MKNLSKFLFLINHIYCYKIKINDLAKFGLAGLVFVSIASNIKGQNSIRSERCNTMQALQQRLNNDARYAEFYDAANSIPTTQRNGAISCDNSNTINVPVAFHFNPAFICADLACILVEVEDQLEALNNAYGNNTGSTNEANCPAAYQDANGNSVASTGTCINFCYAIPPPNNEQNLQSCDLPVTIGEFNGGLATGGTGAPGWEGILNIFVTDNYQCLGISDGIPGLANGDGVSVCAAGFGGSDGPSGSCGIGLDNEPFFDEGATLVHEIGHYLGLFHTHFDGDYYNYGSCMDNDQNPPGPFTINDTPVMFEPFYGCSTSCVFNNDPGCNTIPIPIANYMAYSDDACMSMFTEDQAAVLNYWAQELFGNSSTLCSSATGVNSCGGFITQNCPFTCPSNEEVVCEDDITPGQTPISNCSNTDVTITGPEVNGIPNCPATTYVFTFTPACEDPCTQTFTINNDEPTIDCPADETVECFIDIEAGTPTTNISCGLNGMVDISDPILITGADLCDGATYGIIYTVTDDCGRMDSCTQTFTLANAAPTINCPADETVECFADIEAGTPTTTISCGLTETINISDPTLATGVDNCNEATYEIVYSIMDECGRMDSCTQTFTLANAAPTITCPADETVECFIDIEAGTPTTTISCGLNGMVDISDPTLITGADLCDGATYGIIYTVTNDCGRMDSCTQTFTLANAAPTITCPADETVECFADIEAGTPITTISCGLTETINISEPTLATGTNNCNEATYEIVYSIMDECGRMDSCTQTFTLANAAPTITCPADETVECFADIEAGTPTTTISCGLTETINISEPTLAIGTNNCNEATYEIVYSIIDDCGRMESCIQTFTLSNAAPTIICPADETVECFADIEAGTPTTTISCGLTETINISDPTLVTGVDNCNEATYEIVYSVMDDCGRMDSCTQTFTIANVAPTITCPADETVECFADIEAGTPTTTISCGLTETINISDPTLVAGIDNCNEAIYEIVYSIMDECGRMDSCTQTFTIANAAPTITCPADETVECFADITAGIPTTSTSCGLGENITISDPILVDGMANCDGAIYEISYLIADNCNRVDSCIQSFTITNAAPVLECLDDCPVACETDINPGIPEFTVSCGDGELSIGEAVIEGLPGCDGTTYTYTYTVTDECGRIATCNQVFTLTNDCQFIDFDFDDENELHPGTIIGHQYDDFEVQTEYHGLYPILFDTGNPTSNDFDLGTPNENYGGPGIGNGGEENTTFQGNALIVSKDKHTPNETEGQLIFNFFCSVTIKTIDLLDMKCDESEVELYDEHHNLIAYLDIPAYGVNSFNTFDVFISGVYTMIVDLDCGGGVTGFKYCKDGSPGTLCDDSPNPELCYDYPIDHGDCGVGWNHNASYGTAELGDELVVINIDDDEDHILENTNVDGMGLEVGIDPDNVHDELIICYNLSKASNHIVFDITDLDYKDSGSKQQEAVCVYGLLGDNPTPIFPEITNLDGSVQINGNCAEGTANSAHGDDESVLVEFTNCIDKIVIEYGTGSQSPTHNPTYSKIIIGESIFTIEQCKISCDCLDSDEDGVCDNNDICEGGNDNDDFDEDGIPNFCDDDCDGSIEGGDDDADGICNNVDACPGFDDSIDENNNGIPDGCDLLKLGIDFDLIVYPNPITVGSTIVITLTESYENVDLLIYDELGRLIDNQKLDFSYEKNMYKLSQSTFNSGIYFVKIQANAFTSKVYKLIVVD